MLESHARMPLGALQASTLPLTRPLASPRHRSLQVRLLGCEAWWLPRPPPLPHRASQPRRPRPHPYAVASACDRCATLLHPSPPPVRRCQCERPSALPPQGSCSCSTQHPPRGLCRLWALKWLPLRWLPLQWRPPHYPSMLLPAHTPTLHSPLHPSLSAQGSGSRRRLHPPPQLPHAHLLAVRLAALSSSQCHRSWTRSALLPLRGCSGSRRHPRRSHHPLGASSVASQAALLLEA